MPTFSPKAPGETARFTLDFDRLLGDGVTIASGTASMTVLDGTDPNPGAMVGAVQVIQSLAGNPSRALGVMVTGGTAGVRYGLQAIATTTDGQTLPLAGDFYVLPTMV